LGDLAMLIESVDESQLWAEWENFLCRWVIRGSK